MLFVTTLKSRYTFKKHHFINLDTLNRLANKSLLFCVPGTRASYGIAVPLDKVGGSILDLQWVDENLQLTCISFGGELMNMLVKNSADMQMNAVGFATTTSGPNGEMLVNDDYKLGYFVLTYK